MMIPGTVEHRLYPKLLRAIEWLRFIGLVQPWQGIAYRYVPEAFSSDAEIVSGNGAWRAGGRWNYPETMRVMYGASTPELAHHEFFAYLRKAGFADHDALPLVGKAIHVKAANCLDLRDKRVLAELGVTRRGIARCKWREFQDQRREALTQAIGRAALHSGIDVLLVPPSQTLNPADYNIAVFPEQIAPEGLTVMRKCLTKGRVRA